MTGLFVTGTDTGVGKTFVIVALVRALQARGGRVACMKPLASGAHATPQGLRNEDALALMAAANIDADYEEINPYCFGPAIAPHLAARDAGVPIDIDKLVDGYRALARRADVVLIEGAGGWRLPLHPAGFLSDFVQRAGVPTLLVVGLRLGCLNHAVLTAEAIERDTGTRLAGWIGNRIDPGFERAEDNIDALKGLLRAPCLGIMPWRADGAAAPDWLQTERLAGLLI